MKPTTFLAALALCVSADAADLTRRWKSHRRPVAATHPALYPELGSPEWREWMRSGPFGELHHPDVPDMTFIFWDKPDEPDRRYFPHWEYPPDNVRR